MTLGPLDVNMSYCIRVNREKIAWLAREAEYKTGNNGSGANLGFEQKLWTADKMRSVYGPGGAQVHGTPDSI